MASAPRDGTIIRLLVEFEDGNLEDSPDPQWTIGGNTYENTHGEDAWLFAGWDWQQDRFTQGTGKPIGWLPMLDTRPSAPMAHEGKDAQDAARYRYIVDHNIILSGTGWPIAPFGRKDCDRYIDAARAGGDAS